MEHFQFHPAGRRNPDGRFSLPCHRGQPTDVRAVEWRDCDASPGSCFNNPPHQEVITHTELEQLRDATVEKATYELLNTLSQHKAEPSMADWLNFHSTVKTSTNCPCWTTNIYISLSISVTTLIIYHGICTVWSKFLNRCTLCKPVKGQDHKESRAPTPIPQPRIGQATGQGPSPPGPSKDEAPLSHAVYAVHDNALQ